MRLKFFCLILLSFGAVAAACSSSDDTPVKTEQPDATVLANDANEIPCGPRHVLQSVCQQCHTRPMKNGAPFGLINRSDLFVIYEDVIIHDLMVQQIESRRMPLAPVTIDDASRDILLQWLKDGAPAVAPQACDDAGADAGPDAADDGGDDGATDGASDADVDAGDASDDGPDE